MWVPRPARDGPHDTAGTNEPVRHYGWKNPRDQAKAAVGRLGFPSGGLYSGVKAFLDKVTKVAAAEFAGRGITVNAVGPGSTATGPFGQLTAARWRGRGRPRRSGAGQLRREGYPGPAGVGGQVHGGR